jgi:hypothetical protein
MKVDRERPASALLLKVGSRDIRVQVSRLTAETFSRLFQLHNTCFKIQTKLVAGATSNPSYMGG